MKIELLRTSLDAERLAGLVFELAGQLHAERARRLALEFQLDRAGLLPDGWEQEVQADGDFRDLAGAALQQAMDGLLRVLEESDDPRTPLRHEAASDEEE